MKRLQEVLENKEDNSIMPFFWQHGEEKKILCAYMDKMKESHIGGVCVEARPHPNFGKEQWWNDMNIIVQKAKKEEMEVWILDDSHFPTGYANGLVVEKYPQFLKKYLDCRRFDVVGPLNDARMNLRFLKGKPWQQKGREHDEILGIYAAQRVDHTSHKRDPILTDTLIDVTDKLEEGILYWDIPQGNWSIFVVFTTRIGGEEDTKDYLNPLVKEATEVLIEAVYEPHFKHFEKEFGTTITAFFSDEPRFGNAKGTDKAIGKTEMVLPWCDGLQKKLPFKEKLLPLLFAESENQTMSQVRYQYMDFVTDLYAENFSETLGAWCRAHGVKYVGHNIEDNGAHSRLGYGSGHIFRAQKGQSYAGIDVISNQIAPGYDFHHDAFTTGGHDGSFYHYGLAHLGASIAQADSRKKGIAMCEAFGAYGWNEGLKWMKWITDHLLSRGINYFVPHAFNPKEYPDWDCPPHFYAHGNNPQYRYFKVLMDYTQRMCHLLQCGIHAAPVALLYPAEGEWSGISQSIEDVLCILDQNQIEANIVPMDAIHVGDIHRKYFKISENEYQCLLIPYMEFVPEKHMKIFLELSKQQIPVVFVKNYPRAIMGDVSESRDNNQILEVIKQSAHCVPCEELASFCNQWRSVYLNEGENHLISYHYVQPDGDIYMFFNENTNKVIQSDVKLNTTGIPMCYNGFHNELTEVVYYDEAKIRIPLLLHPYESQVIIVKKKWDGYKVNKVWNGKCINKSKIEGTWMLSFSDALNYKGSLDDTGFIDIGKRDSLRPISNEKEYRDKTGTIRYKKTFEWNKNTETRVFLNLGDVYETAEVFLNKKCAGVCICPPYRVEITQLLHEGENELIIEVTNTLGNENKDFMSQYTPIEPFGLTGPVIIEEEKEC